MDIEFCDHNLGPNVTFLFVHSKMDR